MNTIQISRNQKYTDHRKQERRETGLLFPSRNTCHWGLQCFRKQCRNKYLLWQYAHNPHRVCEGNNLPKQGEISVLVISNVCGCLLRSFAFLLVRMAQAVAQLAQLPPRRTTLLCFVRCYTAQPDLCRGCPIQPLLKLLFHKNNHHHTLSTYFCVRH